ncbi:hypothetical protein [Pseudomonas sp. NBRC 111119]|uniref:hypothetical protein n=1 Tax=Pseudomonas sp. NBRC 111119 TaxID=1661034 RepID=UPI000761E316|nr:hypothetical protein [Pseudomonas sp. NBRC 111119]
MQDSFSPAESPASAEELPKGVFAPMPGYTHADFLALADTRALALLEAQEVDPGLIRETLIALATHLYQALEEAAMEYLISTCHQQPCDESLHASNMLNLAEETGAIGVDAAADSLSGSPILRLGKSFYGRFIGEVGDALREHVLGLRRD